MLRLRRAANSFTWQTRTAFGHMTSISTTEPLRSCAARHSRRVIFWGKSLLPPLTKRDPHGSVRVWWLARSYA